MPKGICQWCEAPTKGVATQLCSSCDKEAAEEQQSLRKEAQDELEALKEAPNHFNNTRDPCFCGLCIYPVPN